MGLIGDPAAVGALDVIRTPGQLLGVVPVAPVIVVRPDVQAVGGVVAGRPVVVDHLVALTTAGHDRADANALLAAGVGEPGTGHGAELARAVEVRRAVVADATIADALLAGRTGLTIAAGVGLLVDATTVHADLAGGADVVHPVAVLRADVVLAVLPVGAGGVVGPTTLLAVVVAEVTEAVAVGVDLGVVADLRTVVADVAAAVAVAVRLVRIRHREAVVAAVGAAVAVAVVLLAALGVGAAGVGAVDEAVAVVVDAVGAVGRALGAGPLIGDAGAIVVAHLVAAARAAAAAAAVAAAGPAVARRGAGHLVLVALRAALEDLAVEPVVALDVAAGVDQDAIAVLALVALVAADVVAGVLLIAAPVAALETARTGRAALVGVAAGRGLGAVRVVAVDLAVLVVVAVVVAQVPLVGGGGLVGVHLAVALVGRRVVGAGVRLVGVVGLGRVLLRRELALAVDADAVAAALVVAGAAGAAAVAAGVAGVDVRAARATLALVGDGLGRVAADQHQTDTKTEHEGEAIALHGTLPAMRAAVRLVAKKFFI